MKSVVIVLLSACLCLFGGAAHADNDATATVAAQAAARARGMLYRVRHGDNTAWLFGTIHVGTPDFFPLDAQVTQALSGASKLVLEIDIRRPEPFQAALHKHGYYPPGDSVDRHLPADDLARLDAALRQFGITPHQVRHMKPWLLANLLVGLDLERNGYRRSHGTEMFLLSLAAQDAKAVDELESAEYQMALFDGMPDAMQVRYLRENLAELGDGNALKKSVALIDAWATANGEAAEAFVRDTRGENSASSEFTLRVLLDKRNPEMATKIEALLRGGEAAFVGVGLLHMVGENGLPALLKQRGYEVEKVY